MSKNYETVFILTSILSEQQSKDTVEKFKGVLSAAGAEFINEEQWGLRKLAYPIDHKTNGYYTLLEFSAPTTAIAILDTEFRRDERVVRYLTTVLDKHSLAYNEKRRNGAFKKKDVAASPATTSSNPS